MDRLTDRTRNHGIYLTGQNMGATGYVPDDVLKRLAAYEDTGLTPGEVARLKTLAGETLQENAKLLADKKTLCEGCDIARRDFALSQTADYADRAAMLEKIDALTAENARLRAERDKAVELAIITERDYMECDKMFLHISRYKSHVGYTAYRIDAENAGAIPLTFEQWMARNGGESVNNGERIVHMVCRWAMVMLFIACLWQMLELMLYGKIQPRTVDSIMWGLWGVTLIFAYREGKA